MLGYYTGKGFFHPLLTPTRPIFLTLPASI